VYKAQHQSRMLHLVDAAVDMCGPGAVSRMSQSHAVSVARSWSWSQLTVLCSQQELGLSVNIVEKNFLKDPSVLETDEFKKVNPAGKCVCQLASHPKGYQCITCATLLCQRVRKMQRPP
jgi:hypothetical protein